MREAQCWTEQSHLSDPVRFTGSVAALPRDVHALARVVQGLLIHSSWAELYGLETPAPGTVDRTTLPLAERLAQVVARAGLPLAEARPPQDRVLATCRDFALMLCGFLRVQGRVCRLRCGFADYLGPAWEDHWICELRDEAEGVWRACDAQIDPVLVGALGIAFDPMKVPEASFITAGQAWQACRTGAADVTSFRHGAPGSLWFLKVNVVRDHLALNGMERSPWDGWRAAPERQRVVRDDELALLDRLAADPEQELVALRPNWLG